ncbi:MAG: Sulfatase [Pseudomonadota bacterium]|jgi:hypothetical protein
MDERNAALRTRIALAACGGGIVGVADAAFALASDPILWGWSNVAVRLAIEAALFAAFGALGGAWPFARALARRPDAVGAAAKALDVWSGACVAAVAIGAACAAPWSVGSAGHAGGAALGGALVAGGLSALTVWAGPRVWGPWLLVGTVPALTLVAFVAAASPSVSAAQASPERPNLLWVTLEGAPASLADVPDPDGSWGRLASEGTRFSLLVGPSSSRSLAAAVWRDGRSPWSEPDEPSAPVAETLRGRQIHAAAFSNRAGLLCEPEAMVGLAICDDDTGWWRGWRRGVIGRLLPLLHGERAAFTDVGHVAGLAASHWRSQVGRRFVWVHLAGDEASLERAVATLLEAVDARGDRGRTLVMVAGLGGSDGGCDLGPEAIDVPGWAWMPGVIPAAAHVWQPVESADLVATSLAVLGLPGEADATSGLDLRPTLEGRGAARRIARSVGEGAPRSVALREPGAWLQWTPTVGLDARARPGEPGEDPVWTAGRLLDRQAYAIGLDGRGVRDTPAMLDATGTTALNALTSR